MRRSFKLLPPVAITSRLLPGVFVNDNQACISIDYSDRASNETGRTRYHYYIDIPGQEPFDRDDLQSGCQGGNLLEGLKSLLGFLTAAADSYRVMHDVTSPDDNTTLFPPNITRWAYFSDYELETLKEALEKNPLSLIELED